VEKTFLLLAILTFASGCATTSGNETARPTLEEQRAESLAKIDKQACAAKGGRVEQGGLLGYWNCVIPFTDAGKVCSDKSDCEGGCYASDNTERDAPAGKAMGKCQATNSPFGCRAEIRSGTLQPFMCVD